MTAERIFRAPMRSRMRDAAPGAGADFGIERGLVGMGEPVSPCPCSITEAVDAVFAEFGEKAARMLERFADLPAGTLVWTKTRDGAYRLGQITGPWRYDSSRAADTLGITHVRSTDWLPERFDTLEVPDGVALTFARGGRNLQQIHDPGAEALSLRMWTASSSRPGPAEPRP